MILPLIWVNPCQAINYNRILGFSIAKYPAYGHNETFNVHILVDDTENEIIICKCSSFKQAQMAVSLAVTQIEHGLISGEQEIVLHESLQRHIDNIGGKIVLP